MFQEYLGDSADIFSGIGALATGALAFKIALGIFRFLSAHFLSRALGLCANLKKAGSWAVVTGCTDGIGRAYAEQLAARGINVVLMSRTQSKLEDMAKEVEEKYKVKTIVIAADFTDANIYESFQGQLEALDIGVLVNNVGAAYDHPEYFCEVDIPNFVRNMINMNCVSVSKMTEIVLPGMLKRGRGYIINIGSSAGSRPLPFLSLYSGTKAFVEIFTRSLNHEHAGRGVTFQAVRPYFVVSKLSKMRKPSMFVPSPTTFVKNALATVGVQSVAQGYWAHDIQEWLMQYISTSFVVKTLKDNRRRALIKKAKAKQEQ